MLRCLRETLQVTKVKSGSFTRLKRQAIFLRSHSGSVLSTRSVLLKLNKSFRTDVKRPADYPVRVPFRTNLQFNSEYYPFLSTFGSTFRLFVGPVVPLRY